MNRTLEYYNKQSYISETRHLYYEEGNGNLIESHDVFMVRNKDKYHIRSYGTEEIVNSDYQVYINHNSKMIIVNDLKANKNDNDRKDLAEVKNAYSQFVQMMDEMSGVESKEKNKNYLVQYKGMKSGVKIYNLSIQTGLSEFSDVEYHVSRRRGALVRSIFTFRDEVEISSGLKKRVKVVIESRKFKRKKHINRKYFSSDDIFTKDKTGKLVLTEKYRDYSLLD